MQHTMTAVRADTLGAAAQGFAFSGHDFDRVRKLIHREAGISLAASKRSMVYSRLSRRLRQTGRDSFDTYLDWLESEPTGVGEWEHFVNALTTNLTSFWREAHHFPILAELIERSVRERGQARLWCCAASTGEEPYTMAITAMQACGSRTPPVRILATDIATDVLATARKGVYEAERVARVEAPLLHRYFLRGRGSNAGKVQVRPDVRALVEFRPLNLLAPRWQIERGFDAIFCRNVMIYFDKATQRRVLQGLAAHLAPHGLLFAGHSENFTQARDLFELQGRTVYELAPALREGMTTAR